MCFTFCVAGFIAAAVESCLLSICVRTSVSFTYLYSDFDDLPASLTLVF